MIYKTNYPLNESERKTYQDDNACRKASTQLDLFFKESQIDSNVWQRKVLAAGIGAFAGIAALYSLLTTAEDSSNTPDSNSQNAAQNLQNEVISQQPNDDEKDLKNSSSTQKPLSFSSSEPSTFHATPFNATLRQQMCGRGDLDPMLNSKPSSILLPLSNRRSAATETRIDPTPTIPQEENLDTQSDITSDTLIHPPITPNQEQKKTLSSFVLDPNPLSQSSKDVLSSVAESNWKALIDSYLFPALPWIIAALTTVWFAKRHFLGNGEIPQVPPFALGLAPLSYFPPNDIGGSSLNVLNDVILAARLFPQNLRSTEAAKLKLMEKFVLRTPDANLNEFYRLIEEVRHNPLDHTFAEFTALFEHLIQDLNDSLRPDPARAQDMTLLSDQIQDAYRNAVDLVRTKHPLIKIPDNSRVGVREHIENLAERDALADLRITSIRRIAGDGNCFYTSLATLLLEAIAQRRFSLTDEWLSNHFRIPNYPNQDLLRFSTELLRLVQNQPSQLENILQDPNLMLPLVRYLRSAAAHSIQQGWIWDSSTQSPARWLDNGIRVSAENTDIFRQVQEILREYQSIHENGELAVIFSEYVGTLAAPNADQDPILALLLCILDRSLIEGIVNERGIDLDSLYSIRFFLTDARFIELEARFNRLNPSSLSPSERAAYLACKDALNRLKENAQRLRRVSNTPGFQKLLDELMRELGENPNSPTGSLIRDQAEGWRAVLLGEYFEDRRLGEASIPALIEQYLETMGRDAMQQTIEALSRQLAFPIEINLLGEFQHTIASTIDGREALGSVVRSGEHYFIGYR